MQSCYLRYLLFVLSASAATFNLCIGIYMDEMNYIVSMGRQIFKGLEAKQTFPPLKSSVIEPWPEPPASREELFKDKPTTKVLWGYWHQGEDNLPGFCELAVRTWRLRHPDWNIVILGDHNYRQYMSYTDIPSTFESLKIQHRSDIVRLAVMRRYGGIYLDVSYLLAKALDDMWDLAEQNHNVYITSMISVPTKGRLMPFPNNALLIAPEPQNPLFVAWHKVSREYLEHPSYTTELMKRNPVMSRVSPFLDDPAFGPISAIAPYNANNWALTDVLYFEPAIRSYVANHVYILPTYLWTFDFMMVELLDLTEDEAYTEISRSDSWAKWLGKLPKGVRAHFKDEPEAAEHLYHLGNAMKVSSDLCLTFDKEPRYHLSRPSTFGRVLRMGLNQSIPTEQATDRGAYLVEPFYD